MFLFYEKRAFLDIKRMWKRGSDSTYFFALVFLCIDRLNYLIACDNFPNYFIPEHNMIDGKLSHDELKYLSLTLSKMNMCDIGI